ncbi:MAG: DNA polymerase III subunit gamma/tau [Planctomycetales bacterium]
MEYTVLARRFRPQSFGEVVGQEMISQALRNAIAAQRVAHAYLFTGARGVGKTSTARILAKSLNCPATIAGDPCNQCEICHSISVGSDVDVLEIDGASNRGIDEIRSLRANVNIKPMRCHHKIYIIDEVHMLTKEAFNALLKTLEEPPPNVKFIFCTTDPQKVPETILSRCQRFDFGTIATATIKQRLTEIAAAEGVVVEPAAVDLVARRAAGSMRDSQSLFDQLLAFGGKNVSAAEVHRLLGTAPDDRLTELAGALIARARGRALELFERAISEGAQVSELTDQLLVYFRDLMVVAAGASEGVLMSVGEDQREVVAEQGRAWGLASAMAAMQILAETKGRMKGVAYGRILAELALVRIASLEDLERLGEVIEWIKSGKLTAGTIAAPAATRTLPPPAATPRSTAPAAQPPYSAPRAGSIAATVPELPPPDLGSETVGTDPASDSAGVQEAVPVAAIIPFEKGRENDIWSQTLALLSGMTKTYAKNVACLAISAPNQLVLTFPKSYHHCKQHFERVQELQGLERVVERIVGQTVRITLELSQADAASPIADTRTTRAEVDQRHQAAEKDPLVQRALAAFDATLVRVETVKDSGAE